MKRVLSLLFVICISGASAYVHASHAPKTAISKTTRNEMSTFISQAKSELQEGLEAIKARSTELKLGIKQKLECEGFALTSAQEKQLDKLKTQVNSSISQLKTTVNKALKKLSKDTKLTLATTKGKSKKKGTQKVKKAKAGDKKVQSNIKNNMKNDMK